MLTSTKMAAPVAAEPDAFTLRHLDAWLDHVLRSDDDRAAIRAAMLQAVADDVGLLEEGWPRVRFVAVGW